MAAQPASDGDRSGFTGRDIFRRVAAQRAQRYLDPGPDLGSLGVARYRLENARLFIGYARIPPANLDAALDRVDAYVRARGLRAVWTLFREMSSEPDLLERILPARGYTLDERLILMARRGALEQRVNPAVTVAPITAFTAMRAYERGSRGAFYDDPTPDESLVTARASERLRQQDNGWFRYYAASLGATIAGGLYVSLWEDVPTIMGVYTVDHARRRGVATAALKRAVDDLRQGRHDTYCLFVKVGNPAARLYEDLGFCSLGVETTYIQDNQRNPDAR
jgi:GNAT superfamily N-acetyltransferase